MRALELAQAVAGGVVLRRLAPGRVRHPPLAAPVPTSGPAGVPAVAGVSVVIPARDEAERIGPCLSGLRDAAGLLEVLVVDDGSTDATAAVAREHGARVLPAGEPSPGWVGKPWALQVGLEAARGEIVVSLDADTRPRPGLLPALVAALEDADLVSVGAVFACRSAGERLLHPSMLASLVYRYGVQDAMGSPPPPHRLLISGQCTAVRREALLEAGGYRAAAGHLTDDAAFARPLAAAGWRVVFRDAVELLAVEMHASTSQLWREWGRSLALTDVTSPRWRAADLAVVWLTMAAPPLKLLARRAAPLDGLLLLVRWGLLGGLARTYARRGAPFWLSPLADPATALRLTASVLRPARTWRGRTYA